MSVLGAVPRLAPLRETLERLPTFDVRQVDDLELYALAMAEAHGQRRASAEPPNDIAGLVRSQRETRARLLVDCKALGKSEP